MRAVVSNPPGSMHQQQHQTFPSSITTHVPVQQPRPRLIHASLRPHKRCRPSQLDSDDDEDQEELAEQGQDSSKRRKVAGGHAGLQQFSTLSLRPSSTSANQQQVSPFEAPAKPEQKSTALNNGDHLSSITEQANCGSGGSDAEDADFGTSSDTDTEAEIDKDNHIQLQIHKGVSAQLAALDEARRGLRPWPCPIADGLSKQTSAATDPSASAASPGAGQLVLYRPLQFGMPADRSASSSPSPATSSEKSSPPTAVASSSAPEPVDSSMDLD